MFKWTQVSSSQEQNSTTIRCNTSGIVKNSDMYFDHIEKKLAQPEFLPRALFEQFNIEVLATTDTVLSDLNGVF